MDIIRLIENDLDNHYYDNIIYYLDKKEKDKYEKIKELLNHDYGYLDIVLDFKDYDKLKPLFEQIPDNDNSTKISILSDYLNYSILSRANITTLDNIEVSKVGEILFGKDLDRYYNMDEILFNMEVFDTIKNKVKTDNKKNARIHYLLDNVDDFTLQKCINDLYVYRVGIAMMGYTTKELSSTLTTNNHMMERVHEMLNYIKQKKKIRGGIIG